MRPASCKPQRPPNPTAIWAKGIEPTAIGVAAGTERDGGGVAVGAVGATVAGRDWLVGAATAVGDGGATGVRLEQPPLKAINRARAVKPKARVRLRDSRSGREDRVLWSERVPNKRFSIDRRRTNPHIYPSQIIHSTIRAGKGSCDRRPGNRRYKPALAGCNNPAKRPVCRFRDGKRRLDRATRPGYNWLWHFSNPPNLARKK